MSELSERVVRLSEGVSKSCYTPLPVRLSLELSHVSVRVDEVVECLLMLSVEALHAYGPVAHAPPATDK